MTHYVGDCVPGVPGGYVNAPCSAGVAGAVTMPGATVTIAAPGDGDGLGGYAPGIGDGLYSYC